jgi:hypothetical protein
MLQSHMSAIEQFLLAYAQIQENTGHSLHKGTPREFFVNEFLRDHLSENVAIGTGEIIDSNSRPGSSRNQMDIVLYKRSFPKLAFGGGISGFLVESVLATIEVKSKLTEEELRNAFHAARNVKLLKPHLEHYLSMGHFPPSILSFVVAYDGPAKMSTIRGWIPKILRERSISYPVLPAAFDERIKIPAPSVDAIFVLGKGFVYFDNALVGFMNDDFRRANPTARWISADVETGTLLYLFLLLTKAMCNAAASFLVADPYVQRVQIPQSAFSFGE